MMRLIQSPATIGLLVGAVLMLGFAVLLSSATSDPASASHAGGMHLMSIDMDPGATPANTGTTLGTREFCAQINENDTLDADEDAVDEVEIDVTAEGIPAYDDGGTPTYP